VIDDTFLKSYQILTVSGGGRAGPLPSSATSSAAQGHILFLFGNLMLANRNLPAMIWCFVGRTSGWRL